MNTPNITASYLNQHRIIPLFQELTALLVYVQPANPRQYLIETLEKIKQKNAFPYRPQDLEFLFPALTNATEERAPSQSKPSSGKDTVASHSPSKKTPAQGGQGKGGKAVIGDEEEAAVKIQSVYRGHNARKSKKKKQQTVSFNPEEEEKAATRIQSMYRGHRVRKSVSSAPGEDESANTATSRSKKAPHTPPLHSIDEADAAVKIQSVYRGHRVRKTKGHSSDDEAEAQPGRSKDKKAPHTPPLHSIDEADAAVKIQSVYRGHRVRKTKGYNSDQETLSPQPQFLAPPSAQVNEADAAVKIQSVYRGHRVRRTMPQGSFKAGVLLQGQSPEEAVARAIDHSNALRSSQDGDGDGDADGDGDDHELNKAALKIQSLYRGHIVRKQMGGIPEEAEELIPKEDGEVLKQTENTPGVSVDDVDDPEQADRAAVRIQASFRGYQARKEVKAMRSGEQNEGGSEQPANE